MNTEPAAGKNICAGFWLRLSAWMLDETLIGTAGIIFGAVSAFVLGLAGVLSASSLSANSFFIPGEAPHSDTLHLSIEAAAETAALFVLQLTPVAYLLIKAAYCAAFESSEMQATPGKMALGLKVTDEAGNRLAARHALGRFFACFVTWLVFPLFAAGHLAAGLTARRQSAHDLIARTLVVKNADARAAVSPGAPDEAALYGGFWIRFGALLLDSFIFLAALTPLLFTLGYAAGVEFWMLLEEDVTPELQAFLHFMGLAVTAAIAAYTIGFNSSSMQGTPGKRAVGLKVVDVHGARLTPWRAAGRYLASVVSTYFLLGCLMAGWTERKRAMHDIIAGTRVTLRRAGPLAPAPAGRYMADEVFARTFIIFQRGFRPLLAAVFFGWALPLGVIAALVFVTFDFLPPGSLEHTDINWAAAGWAAFILFAANWIFYALASGGVFWGVNAGLNSAAPTAGQMLARGVMRTPHVAVMMLIAVTASFAGYIFMVIPGLFVLAVFAVAAPAAAAEDGGLLDGLKRSWRLTEGARLMTFFAAMLIGMAPSYLWTAGFQIMFDAYGTVLWAAGGESSGFFTAAVFVILLTAAACLHVMFSQIAFASLYHQLLGMKETPPPEPGPGPGA